MENIDPDLAEAIADLELDLDVYGQIQSSTFTRLQALLGRSSRPQDLHGYPAVHFAETGHRFGRGCCAAAAKPPRAVLPEAAA